MSEFWRDDVSLENEPYKVSIKRHQFVDSSRDDRVVKTKVYYPLLKKEAVIPASGRTPELKKDAVMPTSGRTPELKKDAVMPTSGRTPELKKDAVMPVSGRTPDKQKYPVIVWSHGLGGSVDGASFLARFLCSHGYIIVHVQHHGTDSSLWEGKEGHPWDIIRSQVIERSDTLNRFHDVPFMLDQLPAYFEENEIDADMDALGMSGHSFGALTTQVMGGMLFPDEGGVLQKYNDTRFKAGILYSPGPIAHLGVDAPEDIYGSIDIPLFHMTGTDDDSPVENWDYKKRLVVYENSNRADKHLLIIKEGDHMVFNGSRGKLGVNPNKDKHEGIIKISALCFWDMMLKHDDVAKDWFTGSGVSDWLGIEGKFK